MGSRAEYLREWRRRNPGKNAEHTRRWRETNPSEAAATGRRWASRNPDKIRAKKKRHEARRRGATTSRDPRITALYFIARWLRAQGDNVHVDHIYPLAKGGKHVYFNLQILPAIENLRKGAKVL